MSLVVSESAETFGISLATLDVLRLQIASARHRLGQSAGHVTIDFAVCLVEAGLANFHEVTISDRVTNSVLRLQWVDSALGVPMSHRNISIVNIVVAGGSVVGPCSILCALNILNVHDVADGLGGRGLRARALNVVDHHLVTNVLIGFGLNVVETLELVGRVEGVRWLSSASRFELVDVRLTSLNIFVGQVELWLVHFEVEHAGPSAQHIKSIMEIRSVSRLCCPHSWLGSLNVATDQVIAG